MFNLKKNKNESNESLFKRFKRIFLNSRITEFYKRNIRFDKLQK
ncbi:hypothetical protein [Candidatus Vidania fulgoroideorum]